MFSDGAEIDEALTPDEEEDGESSELSIDGIVVPSSDNNDKWLPERILVFLLKALLY